MCDISLWTHSFTKVRKCEDVDTLSQSDAKTAATTSLHSEAGSDPFNGATKRGLERERRHGFFGHNMIQLSLQSLLS